MKKYLFVFTAVAFLLVIHFGSVNYAEQPKTIIIKYAAYAPPVIAPAKVAIQWANELDRKKIHSGPGRRSFTA